MNIKLNAGQSIGLALILGSIGLIAWQATKQSSSVTFFTPGEVYAQPESFANKAFRVSGLVLAGTKSWSADDRKLKFRMTDLQGHDFKVTYIGTPPDLFKEGQGVVVEGKLDANDPEKKSINATLLMVKHSEVYDTQTDKANLREAKLLDSIRKDENLDGASK